jgi:hypothetical protein
MSVTLLALTTPENPVHNDDYNLSFIYQAVNSMKNKLKIFLKIPEELSDTVNQRRTDYTMVKNKKGKKRESLVKQELPYISEHPSLTTCLL